MLSFSDKTKQKKEKMRTTVAVLFEKKEVSYKFRLRINTAL